MAHIKADEITQLLREQIQNYDSEMHVDEVGTIISLGDGIARIHGLEKVMAGELIEFPHGVAGLAMNLDESEVGAVLLGDYTELQRRRPGEALRQDHERGCRPIAGRPRGERSRPADRRQGPDRRTPRTIRSSGWLRA